MTITHRGRELAEKLAPAIGYTRDIAATCSLIARHSKTYHGIQEAWCNEEMSETRVTQVEKHEAALEQRITQLVESLPHADEGPWGVLFTGDPRGFTVYIVPPPGLESMSDDWGKRGIGANV